MTAPLEIRTATPKHVPASQISQIIETRERATSSATTPPKPIVEECTEPSMSGLAITDDQMETVKATYEDKIAKIHENYQ